MVACQESEHRGSTFDRDWSDRLERSSWATRSRAMAWPPRNSRGCATRMTTRRPWPRCWLARHGAPLVGALA